MKTQDMLDLKSIETLASTSFLRSLLIAGSSGLQGAGAGLAASGLLFTLLGLIGVSAMFVLQVISAATGITLFAIGSFAVVGYQLWKNHQKLLVMAKDFNKATDALKEEIIILINNHQLLEETKKLLVVEKNDLTTLLDQIANEEEKQRVTAKVMQLDHDIRDLEEEKTDLVTHLKLTLNHVVGNSYYDKINHLFGTVYGSVGKEAVQNYGKIKLVLPDSKINAFDQGLETVWKQLDTPLAENPRVERLSSNFNDAMLVTKPEGKVKTPSGIKRASYVLTAIGGFLGGAGGTIAVASFIVGGAAALTVIGWPILVGAVAVGLLAMTGSLLYYHYVDKKHRGTAKQLDVNKNHVDKLGSYMKKNVNENLQTKLADLNKRNAAALNDVVTRLNVHEESLRDYLHDSEEHTRKLHSYITEMEHFRVYSHVKKEEFESLKQQMSGTRALLVDVKRRIGGMVISPSLEVRKNNLLNEVDQAIGVLEANQADLERLKDKYSRSVHQAPERAHDMHLNPVEAQKPPVVVEEVVNEEDADLEEGQDEQP